MRAVPALVILGAVLSAMLMAPTTARAGCVCRCVDGAVVPICDSAIDVPPVCPARVCPVVPPRVKPITPPRVPPVGTEDCEPRQVYNPITGRYEWQVVCE